MRNVMNKISIIMSVYNGERYLFETIDSVLKQSFGDFEFIIIDDGSTDNTLSIIRSFKDKRIFFIQNEHNYVESLNLGLKKASSKYIARMDSDDIMHVDRLKIQYAIMEEEPDITVCSSWITLFGDRHSPQVISSLSGIIEDPILKFISDNFIFNPTAFIRNSFLKKNNLQYKNYPYAEDYKLWVETAKLNGVFFIESQPLLYYRSSKDQVTVKYSEEMTNSSFKIKREIINTLIERSFLEKIRLQDIYNNLMELESNGLVSHKEITNLFYKIFVQINNFNYKSLI